ncbi:hypothetical protein AA310_17370, partial [Arthrobacter sp. YC-RL1]
LDAFCASFQINIFMRLFLIQRHQNVRGARVGVLPTVHNRKRLGQAFTKGGQNFIRQLRRTFWSSAAILR